MPYEYIGRLESISYGGICKISANFVIKAPVIIFAAVALSFWLPASESLDESETVAGAAGLLSPVLVAFKTTATASGPNQGS